MFFRSGVFLSLIVSFNGPAESFQSTLTDLEMTEPNVATFQHGRDGFFGGVDTEIWEVAPTRRKDQSDRVTVDGDNSGGQSQVLMKFAGMFGSEEHQIPPRSRITKATLTIVAFDPGSTVSLYRMLVPWDGSATWDRMVGGISADGFEAAPFRDGFTFGNLVNAEQSIEFDVTTTVQAWSNGASNYGWVFLNSGPNGWDFFTCEDEQVAQRPRLVIEYIPHIATGTR